MTVLEFLSAQLDKEMTEADIPYARVNFTENMEFWQLCLEARNLLLEEKQGKKGDNASNIK